MRKAWSLCLLAVALGCAREVGTRQARALAGSDVRVAPGELAEFTASCAGCVGTPVFHWSLSVAPDEPICTLSAVGSAGVSATCQQPGLWVLRVDVTDDDGPGQPDYANLIVSSSLASDAGTVDAGAADAGEPDAGDLDAGEPDAGSVDAGERDAGSVDAGERDAGAVDAGEHDAGPVDAGPVDGGPLTGTLEVTFPDGTAASQVLPGDLLELHGLPSDPAAQCSFADPGGETQVLPTTAPCTSAVVLLAPTSGISFSATFTRGAEVVHASSSPVAAADVQLIYSSSSAIRTVSVDPVSELALAARPSHSPIVFDPVGQTSTLINQHHDGVGSAGGGVLSIGWTNGNLGRAYPDGGLDQATSNANDFISTATLSGPGLSPPLPIQVATDGSELVAWAMGSNVEEDATQSVDLVADVKLPGGLGRTSAGVLTLAGGDTLGYAPWSDVVRFAQGGPAFVPQAVPTTLSNLILATTAARHDGTLWLADGNDGLYQFLETLGTSTFTLSSAPTLSFVGDGPLLDMSIEPDGIYAGDLWIVGNGFVQRINAGTNQVGAAATWVELDLSPNATAIAIGRVGLRRIIYIGGEDGLYGLTP